MFLIDRLFDLCVLTGVGFALVGKNQVPLWVLVTKILIWLIVIGDYVCKYPTAILAAAAVATYVPVVGGTFLVTYNIVGFLAITNLYFWMRENL